MLSVMLTELKIMRPYNCNFATLTSMKHATSNSLRPKEFGDDFVGGRMGANFVTN